VINIVPIKRKIIDFYINSRGWRTDRKIIVIESDDWGSIRMPSIKVYNDLLSRGYPVDILPYLRYDALESNTDLESLFEVLSRIKDKNGNNPIITANTIMTNPDFDKIRDSGFRHYFYELFIETLKRYPEHDCVYDLYKKGIRQKIFYPQLHGLEHLNVNRWMKAIQDEKSNARVAFDNGFFDLSISHTTITTDSFVDALNPSNAKELVEQGDRLKLASELFYRTFGYRSVTFIAPCKIWRPELENNFRDIGIKNIQSGSYQLIPEFGKLNIYKKKLHYTGERNKFSQSYTVRNCFFEPSSNEKKDVINTCLKQIETAFKNQKPAIISSHRLNYIGYLDINNRNRNLDLLGNLLSKIQNIWPEIEFLTSEDLTRIIN
jgi:hypothetical protein